MAPKRQGDVCRVCGQPRAPGVDMVLCADHYREYMRERSTERNRANGPEYQRIMQYRREAEAIGANEDEAWWIAMAAEGEFQSGRSRPRWLRPFIARELDWLRASASTLADLDARQWQPVKERETVTIDDGWTDEEGVA